MKVGLATSALYSELPADERLLREAFVDRGVDARPAVWTDSGVNWAEFDAVVIRSTWDYHMDVARFSQWVDIVSAQTLLINEPVLVRWNLHKQYLLELQGMGIAIVPTVLLRQGERGDFESIARTFGVNEVVIKPAVSASGYRTTVVGGEYAPLGEGGALLRESVSDHDTLVQPFLREIFDPGERSLMFFDGRFSHAVVRPPLSAGAADGKSPGARLQPPDDQLSFARDLLNCLERTPVYARVDIVPLRTGRVVLAELELVEPSLYFQQCPSSAGAFAEAVIARVGAKNALLLRRTPNVP